MSEISIKELQAALIRIQVLERNLRDAEEANRRLAKQVIKADQRVSDLNGEVLRLGFQLKHHLQLQAERDALAAKLAEMDGQKPVAVVCDTYELRWIGCGPIAPIISRHQIKVGDSLFARPAPAEQPVNARLLETLLYWRDECSGAEPSISAFSRMVDEAIIAAESAPKAVRLTDEEVVDLFAVWNMTDGASHADLMLSVETAVLRKNGIEVAE